VPDSPQVVLYTRRDCHLCDDAAAMLDDLASELRFTITTIDIDTDEAFLARYNDVVPVIVVADKIVAMAPVDRDALRQALKTALA
jgi:glutaredoxin